MSDAEAERLAGRGTTDKLVGRVKEIVGGVVGSDSLTAKGRLQQAEGEARRAAAHHRTEAEVQRLQAREAAVDGAQDAAEVRAEASQEELARKAQLERERLQAHAAAEQAVAGREQAAEAAADAKASVLRTQERLARHEREEALEVVEELEAEATRSEANARELDRLQDVQ